VGAVPAAAAADERADDYAVARLVAAHARASSRCAARFTSHAGVCHTRVATMLSVPRYRDLMMPVRSGDGEHQARRCAEVRLRDAAVG
jgi:hypothetical protein